MVPGKRRYPVAAMFLERFLAPAAAERPPSKPNLVIMTAIPSDPCQFPIGDLINKLSVVNKQDYAHLHSFELHISADIIDPAVTTVLLRTV